MTHKTQFEKHDPGHLIYFFVADPSNSIVVLFFSFILYEFILFEREYADSAINSVLLLVCYSVVSIAY